MQIGYAHVSTDDQHLKLRIDALEKAECEQIFTNKISGTRANRPGLGDALSHIRKGDTLTVWKLDRLGRSVKGLVDLVADLEQRNIHFVRLTDGINIKRQRGVFLPRDGEPGANGA